MKRTTKKERKDNAKNFYQLFNNHEENKACIIVERNNSSRTQFLVVPGALQSINPTVIAESTHLGVEGCWTELINNIKVGISQKTYYEDGFREWLQETLGFTITYCDKDVFIIEKTITQ